MSVISELLKQASETKTQERLAETYLPSSDYTKEKPVSSPVKNKNLIAITALSISILLLCGVLIYIFSANALKIDITVNKKVRASYEDLLSTQKVDFIGDVSYEAGYISLSSDLARRRVAVMIDLKEPMDLSNKYLLISILSKRGGGKLKAIFRDKNHRAYVTDIFDVEEDNSDWQNFIISAYKSKKSIDARNIRHIRLELKSTVRDLRGSEIYIKKVALIDN